MFNTRADLQTVRYTKSKGGIPISLNWLPIGIEAIKSNTTRTLWGNINLDNITEPGLPLQRFSAGRWSESLLGASIHPAKGDVGGSAGPSSNRIFGNLFVPTAMPAWPRDFVAASAFLCHDVARHRQPPTEWDWGTYSTLRKCQQY